MKQTKINLSFQDALSLYKGYSLVGELIGTATFNKEVGYVLASLEKIAKDYNKRLDLIRENAKKEIEEEYGEIPFVINDNSDSSEVEAYYRLEDLTSGKIKELNNEIIEGVEVLELTENDISEQEKVGKKWKDQGFRTNPNFWKLLLPVIKSDKANQIKEEEV